MSIQSINRAVAILRCFSEAEPELSVTQLSQRLDLHKSTVSRMLSTLEEEGLISQNPRNSQYRLGVGLISMAGVALGQVDVRGAAYQYLDSLVQATQETITVNILDGQDCLNVDNKASPKPLRYASWIGRRLPLHCTASGKILLANLTPQQRRELLPPPLRPYTQNTIDTHEALDSELERVVACGYATVEEEFEQAFSAIAAPVLDHRGRVAGAISVSGPTFRMPRETLLSFVEPLMETAALASAELGHRGPLRIQPESA
jgi:DNA-binding IclR family transcriptional regulator